MYLVANKGKLLTRFKMPNKTSSFFFVGLSVILLLWISSTVMATQDLGKSDGSGDSAAASVHIVYVDRPEGEDAEAFHIRTLALVFGSEAAAKEAVIYHYKHAASGFSAKLTPQQVEELSKQPGVLQVIPDQVASLHSGGRQGGVGSMGVM